MLLDGSSPRSEPTVDSQVMRKMPDGCWNNFELFCRSSKDFVLKKTRNCYKKEVGDPPKTANDPGRAKEAPGIGLFSTFFDFFEF